VNESWTVCRARAARVAAAMASAAGYVSVFKAASAASKAPAATTTTTGTGTATTATAAPAVNTAADALLRFYKKAAEGGNPSAQLSLALRLLKAGPDQYNTRTYGCVSAQPDSSPLAALWKGRTEPN